ncbi:hypothetical protein [Flavobacterium tegetincola]|uniref:hypothetical protein n=1 Tax=Flavobacterium tegetincola TaxID=150172 RepID=UPI0003F90249|nr:hypothetical protein [Flavobacterium tegetincola]
MMAFLIYNIIKKTILLLILLFANCYFSFAQINHELKKIKCLDKMPNTYEQIKDLDTIFILYYKSDLDGFEQNAFNKKGSKYNSYNFFNVQFFPLQIYDEIGYEKVNFREPLIMYKRKSFITKNIERTIDVRFLKKYHYYIYTDFYRRKRTTFIIDLDSKVKNKYKIIQVNYPRYIVE